MRALAVVVDPRFLDFDACARERREARLREALVTEVAIERCDMGILRRLTGLNEIEFHTVRVGPFFERCGNEFRSVIDAQTLR